MILGDVLRVLPHVVLGIVQGQRLRKQLQEEDERRQFERAQREFELWRMQWTRQMAEEAYAQQQRLQEGLVKFMESLDPEPIVEAAPPLTPTPPPMQLQIVQPTTRRRGLQRLMPEVRLQLPTPVAGPTLQLSVPAGIQVTPTPTPPPRQPDLTLPTQPPTTPTEARLPTVDAERIIESGRTDLQKAKQGALFVPAVRERDQMMAGLLSSKVANLVSAGLMKIQTGIASRWVREGKAETMDEAMKQPSFWQEVLGEIDALGLPNEIIEPFRRRIAEQRDYWQKVAEKQAELRQKGIESLRWFAGLVGRQSSELKRQADRLTSWAMQLVPTIVRVVTNIHNLPTETLRTELTFIRTILGAAPNLWVNLASPEDVQRVQRLITSVLGEIEQQGQARQELLDRLAGELRRLYEDLNTKANALEAKASELDALQFRVTLEAINEIRKAAGLPPITPDQIDRLVDFITQTPIPTPPAGLTRGIEEEDAAMVPQLRVPQGLRVFGREVPTRQQQPQPATPAPTPSQPTQPTPTQPAQPTPSAQQTQITPTQALAEMTARAVIGAAERRELENARRRIQIELDNLRRELMRVQLSLQPQILATRLEQIRTNIWAARQRVANESARVAWSIAQRIFGGIADLVPRLTTKDGKPIPSDRALHYMKRIWSAAIAHFLGDTTRANRELQNIASEWKRAGYQLPGRTDLLSALLETLLGPSPTQPTTTQSQTAPSKQSSPTFEPSEEDLEDLLGGMPF